MDAIEQAKKTLEMHGYFTDNLWSIHDIPEKYRVSQSEAQEILRKALTNDSVVEHIHMAVDMACQADEEIARRGLMNAQIDLAKRVVSACGVSVVTCGHCGTVLLHDLNEAEVHCFGCNQEQDASDCPDLFYEGMSLNTNTDETTESKSV